MDNGLGSRRIEPSSMLFFYYYYYNYTNKYLKILCLQMEMSGVAEGGDGLGINGARDASHLEPSGMFFSNYLFFTILTSM